MMPELSDELQSVEWLRAAGPGVGAKFRGYSKHDALGEWSTVSHVVEYEPGRVFAWAVADPDQPTATWKFTLRPQHGGTLTEPVDADGARPVRSEPGDRRHARQGAKDRLCPDARVRAVDDPHRGRHQDFGRAAVMRTATTVEAAQHETWEETLDFVVEAEKLGLDICWVAEAWGADAPSALGYLAARTDRLLLGSGIIQIGTRTPVSIAMTALTLARLSGGRFLLGLGPSGPQVIEGLHGVPFAAPLNGCARPSR